MNIRIFPPALILSAALLLFGCRRAVNVEGGSGRGGPVPVLATEVVRKDVPMKVRAIGAVKAPASVTVKPQVGGKIESANFTQGQDVKRGDLLFTIDRRPFEVTLAQARAALDQVKAQAANASDQAARYQTLSRSGAVAAEQFEQIKTALRTTAAAVKSGEAAVESAQLQLDYCEIRSPLSGRAGGFLVDPGNVVQVNQTDLVVINQIDPIEVTFAVAERHLQDIRRYQNEGQLKVMVVPDGANPQPEWGKLTFVDNAVKSATGTIELKAEFANDTKTLWPGQFVDVELWLTIERGAVVVPANAVQTGQQGPFVYVIQPNHTAEARTVELARTEGEDAVIREGLDGGEKIVIDGQSRLGPGAKVEIKTGLGLAAPAPAPGLSKAP